METGALLRPTIMKQTKPKIAGWKLLLGIWVNEPIHGPISILPSPGSVKRKQKRREIKKCKQVHEDLLTGIHRDWITD
jgi:hypothetical protein